MHRIGNQVYRLHDEVLIVSNSFLASHAYNWGLAVLAHAGNPDAQRSALRHNAKKFYAECALGQTNCLIGRALLIETLMFEQDLARAIFAAVDHDPLLQDKGQTLSSVMSYMLNVHELTHQHERDQSEAWQRDLAQAYAGDLVKTKSEMAAGPDPGEGTELVCDAVGAWYIWNEQSEFAADIPSVLTRLRLAAFGFLCFGELASLQLSAHQLAQRSGQEDAAIVLGSDKRTDGEFTIWRMRDEGMDRRVAAIVALLTAEAQRRGHQLFGDDPWFAFPPETPAILRDAFDNFDAVAPDDPPDLTGTDLHRRGLAQLLAESLHNHPDGASHLLWRSKRFTRGGEALDP